MSGTITSKLLSLLFLGVSVFVMVQCCLSISLAVASLTTLGFSEITLRLPGLALRSFVLTIPFCCWPAGKNITKHLKNWHKFQNEFVDITGASFDPSIQKKTLRTVCLEILLMFFSFLLLLNILFESQFSVHFVAVSMELFIFYNFLFYWYINGLFTRMVIKTFSNEMQKNIQASNYDKIKGLVILYPRLCELMDEFVECHSHIFLISVLGNVLFLIFCLYASLILLPSLRSVITALLTGTSLLCLYFYGDVGHKLQRKMTVKLQELLLMQNMKITTPRILNELWIFGQLIDARKLRIMLNGYMTLNRAKISSIISVCLNYVIILRQFGLSYESLEEDDDEN